MNDPTPTIAQLAAFVAAWPADDLLGLASRVLAPIGRDDHAEELAAETATLLLERYFSLRLIACPPEGNA